MKSLLQFLLLIALVVVGKNMKDQQRLAAAPKPPMVQPHVESMQAFFVQHVSYKPAAAQPIGVQYSRKANAVSLN